MNLFDVYLGVESFKKLRKKALDIYILKLNRVKTPYGEATHNKLWCDQIVEWRRRRRTTSLRQNVV